VSETECLLKELEKMLQQVQEPTARAEEPGREQVGMKSYHFTASGSVTGCTAELDKLSQCSLDAPTGSRFQSYCEEDCIVIDGTGLKAGEHIENITNNLRKIDALIAEF
ncbi:hypothetical protein A6R68_19355, partial [Neotoma lepida]